MARSARAACRPRPRRRPALALRAGEEEVRVVALDVGRGGVAGHVDAGPGRSGPIASSSAGVGGLPERLAGLGVEAGEELLGAVEVDAAVVHAHAAAVEVLLFAVRPEDLLRARDRWPGRCGRSRSWSSGPCSRGPPTCPTASGPARAYSDGCRRRSDLRGRRPGRRARRPSRAIHFQTGPSATPSGTTISSCTSPVRGVDQLARLVVGQVERVGRGDHRVAVDHEALGQRRAARGSCRCSR